MVVGSNGLITFDLTQAFGTNAWNFYIQPTPPYPNLASATCIGGTTCGDALNSIMCPYHDIDPSVGGNVYWQIYGNAPCRRLVVTWDSVPMFQCNDSIATQQCVLYEGTGAIEIFLKNKPICPTWDSAEAAEGIEDALGTVAYMVSGRNLPTKWTAQNDGHRFTPTGLAYPVRIDWFDSNHNLLSYNSDSITVCLNGTSNNTVYARATYYTCNNDSVIVRDTIHLSAGGVATSITNFIPVQCHNETNASFTYNVNSSVPFNVYLGASLLGTNSIYSFNNLGPSASYLFKVIDSFGCFSNDTVKIVNPSALKFNTLTTQDASCNGVTDGKIIFTIGGGAAPYFDTINGISSTQLNLNTLAAGSYHIEITDVHHCKIDTFITIHQPPPFQIQIKSITPPSCYGFSDGSIIIKVFSIGIYTIFRDGILQPNKDTLKNISGGNHIIRAQLGANCFHDTTIFVNQPIQFKTWVNDSADISCKGFNDGYFKLSATGGTKYYSFEIPKLIASFITDSVLPHVPKNYYIIYGKDAHGCLDTTSVNIAEPDSILSSNLVTEDASCYFKTDGKIIENVYGGTRPYLVTISPDANSTILSPTQVETGLYNISIVDAHGCKLNESTYVDVKCCIARLPNAFTPNNDGLDEVYKILNPADFLQLYSFEIFSRWGQMVYSSNDKTQGWDGTFNGVKQPVGTYIYQISIGCSKGRTLQMSGNVTLLR
jgi:gliding motility-associated-like protein